MRHFTTSKTEGYLDFITLVKKTPYGFHFGFIVMIVNAWPQLNFFNLNDFLFFAGLGRFLLFKKAESSVIQNFTDWWRGVRDNLDEIQSSLFRQIYRIRKRNNASICACIINQLDFSDATDISVGAWPFLHRNGRCSHRSANGSILL